MYPFLQLVSTAVCVTFLMSLFLQFYANSTNAYVGLCIFEASLSIFCQLVLFTAFFDTIYDGTKVRWTRSVETYLST